MNTINCKGQILNLTSPIVMGVLNMTPDSFYDGGKNTDENHMRSRVDQLVAEGASIIDVGGMSSRPGAEIISAEQEINRVRKAITYIKKQYPTQIISIDTLQGTVAAAAINMGASIVNDISGGTHDPDMIPIVAELNVPYIMMHMQGKPKDMQSAPVYQDVVLEVIKFFAERLRITKKHDIKDVILDPGFGFGKTLEHNYRLLTHLSSFKILERSVLVGVSRKSMLYKPLNITPDDALNATTAAHMLALQNGARILRVHDVKEAKECISIFRLSETYK